MVSTQTSEIPRKQFRGVFTYATLPATSLLNDFAYASDTGLLYRWDGSAWTPITNTSGGIGIFGDGSDGDVTVAGVTTLTRDMYYNNLTINAGCYIITANFRIFVKSTFTNNGTVMDIAAANKNGTSGAGGGGGGVSWAAGTLGSGSDGGNSNVNGNNKTVSLGGNGGAGGRTLTNPPNTGGVATAPVATIDLPRSLPFAILAKDNTDLIQGGASGAGGVVEDSTGGGGGSGGGVSVIAARIIVNNGVFQCDGGNGGAGEDTIGGANGSGGGGGGGGGLLISIYNTASWTTETANGGTGGAGGVGISTTGDPGAAGTAGTVIKISGI